MSLRRIAIAGIMLTMSCGGGGSSRPAPPIQPYEGTFRGVTQSGYPAFAASEGDTFCQLLVNPAGDPYVIIWSERGNWRMEGTFVEDWDFYRPGPSWVMTAHWVATRPTPRSADIELVVGWDATQDYIWWDASTDYLLSAFRCGPMWRED